MITTNSKIITPEEFLSNMPSDGVLFFKFMGDDVCLIGTFDVAEEGLRITHFGYNGWLYCTKELEEFTAGCIADIISFHNNDIYTFKMPENSILQEIREQLGERVIFYKTSSKVADVSFAKELSLGEDTVFVCLFEEQKIKQAAKR